MPAGSLVRGLHSWGASLLVVIVARSPVSRAVPRLVQGPEARKLVDRARACSRSFSRSRSLDISFRGTRKGTGRPSSASGSRRPCRESARRSRRLLSGRGPRRGLGADEIRDGSFRASPGGRRDSRSSPSPAPATTRTRRASRRRLAARAVFSRTRPPATRRRSRSRSACFSRSRISAPAPLEATADPSDSGYVPRPDWYFLPLFQLLHYFPGRTAVVGAVLIPAAIALLLFALPFLDRSPEREPKRRRAWIALGAAIFAGAGLLTAIAVLERPASAGLATAEPPPPPLAFLSADLRNYDVSALSPAVAHGGKLIATKKCLECHLVNGDGNGKGIELKHVAERRTRDWLIAHFKDPQDLVPHSKMPPYDNLPERDLQDIASYYWHCPEGRLALP